MDLGLPSGTLWLDRLVGAQAPNAIGLFYQWGDIVGHSIAEGYNFSTENYEAKGLNLISTDLDSAHDAARAYYGPSAKMPSVSQLRELMNNCEITREENKVIKITSRKNGNFIKVRANGSFNNSELQSIDEYRSWSTIIYSNSIAYNIHSVDSVLDISANGGYHGYNVMAVHS